MALMTHIPIEDGSHDGAGIVAGLQDHAGGHEPQRCQPVKGASTRIRAQPPICCTCHWATLMVNCNSRHADLTEGSQDLSRHIPIQALPNSEFSARSGNEMCHTGSSYKLLYLGSTDGQLDSSDTSGVTACQTFLDTEFGKSPPPSECNEQPAPVFYPL